VCCPAHLRSLMSRAVGWAARFTRHVARRFTSRLMCSWRKKLEPLVSDQLGADWTLNSPICVVASTRELHSELLGVAAEFYGRVA
jgi:hypothetical protein